MKKLVISIFSATLLLSACSNSNDGEEEVKEVKQDKSMTSESLIDEVVANNQDVISYEERGTLTMNDEDELNFIVTIDNDENVKFEVDASDSVFTLYDVNGEKKVLTNGEFETSDIELNPLTYSELVEKLKELPKGDLKTDKDVYVITYDLLTIEDLSIFSNELASNLQDYDVENLSLTLQVNADYKVVRADVEGTLSDDKENYDIKCFATFENIGEVEQIEVPKGE
ncbi:hypothetical protein [Nosocomiicoccus ampullae]|uniref:hypothetical protein n=1 Tax=Nosocomiicoccus ampullae TaxID=489910 RepID=UPI00082BCFF6|nr:hypothetical protein [Nosocomiicoccus ampullae]MDK6863161.1 hypothetical protein [Nosocomiicoccus ampullae]